jgi:hypothetical protein
MVSIGEILTNLTNGLNDMLDTTTKNTGANTIRDYIVLSPFVIAPLPINKIAPDGIVWEQTEFTQVLSGINYKTIKGRVTNRYTCTVNLMPSAIADNIISLFLNFMDNSAANSIPYSLSYYNYNMSEEFLDIYTDGKIEHYTPATSYDMQGVRNKQLKFSFAGRAHLQMNFAGI